MKRGSQESIGDRDYWDRNLLGFSLALFLLQASKWFKIIICPDRRGSNERNENRKSDNRGGIGPGSGA